jgi:hypothetical protein
VDLPTFPALGEKARYEFLVQQLQFNFNSARPSRTSALPALSPDQFNRGGAETLSRKEMH